MRNRQRTPPPSPPNNNRFDRWSQRSFIRPAPLPLSALLSRQPQLPSRSLESGSDPLNERIKKSTDEWIKNRAAREQRRRDLEAEQCTFHPSLGSSKARRAAVDPRLFATSSRSLSSNHIAAPDAFAVRSAALQEAREERLEKMRKENIKLELKEATFQPVTGNTRRVKSGGGSADGTFSADAMVTRDPPAEGSEGADSGFAKPSEDDMSEAQRKFSSSEAKEPVDFKVSVLATTVYSCLLTPILVTRTRNRRINSRMNSRTSSRTSGRISSRINSRMNSRINYHCLGLWHLLRGFPAFIIDTDNST